MRPSPPDAPPARGAPHLLLVDDEPVILQILRAVFEDEPFRVTAVGTGQHALRVIAEDPVDLLITDKNLPDVNGMDLLRALKGRDPRAEAILITGYASLETALSALEQGAFDYLIKPLDNIFDIRAKARRALERRAMGLENARLLADLQARNAALEVALDQARELQAELIQSEKLAGIGTLAAGVAHEISSPLFGVLGLAEALADDPAATPEIQGLAREIVDYSEQIREIVQELSSYSRAEGAGEVPASDLVRAAVDAWRLVERSAPIDGAAVRLELPAALLVRARPNELQQIFVNLIKNAVEAVRSAGGGRVVVRAGDDGSEAWAEVEDDGPGIPTEKRGLVFDPFYTTKSPGQGTGLGLNVVYRIVSKYRGQIHVGSGALGGALFRLRLPIGAAPA
jgi:signal transduction histidine kinase